MLGTFILWLGWIGFNPGSTLGIASPGSAQTAARCVVNTTLSAATCGLVVVVLDKLFGSRTWDVGAVCNGVLGGLVSISAACSTVYPWAAVLIGAIGGIVCFGTSRFVLYVLKVDDPLDAFAVHGACGFWGCLATALLAAPAYGYHGTLDDGCKEGGGVGAFYGGGCLIGVTVATLFAEIAWVSGTSLVLFGGLRLAGLLRVSFESEELGLDVMKHGGTAYENNRSPNEESLDNSKHGGNMFTPNEESLDSSKHGGTMFSSTMFSNGPPRVSTALDAVSMARSTDPACEGSFRRALVPASSTNDDER